MSDRAPPLKSAFGPQPGLDERKADISVKPEKSGVLEIDGKAFPVESRHGKLRPQLPRNRKLIDGAKRDELPRNIEYQKPPKPKVEAHSFKIKAGAASLAALGAGLGSTAGSVVPVIGTAVGAAVGALIGFGVGHLVKKYGRSHSHRGYLRNAFKSLQDQGMKFTPSEKHRLETVRADQWKFLAEKAAPIIDELTKYSTLGRGKKRWAKQFFYQYAAMEVAQYGFRRAHDAVESLLSARERAHKKWKNASEARKKDSNPSAKAPEAVLKPEFVIARKMHNEMAVLGIDTTYNVKAAQPPSVDGTLDKQRSLVTKEWNKLFFDVEKEFGQQAMGVYVARHRRYYDAGNQPYAAIARLKQAKDFQVSLPKALMPFIGPYDEEVRSKVLGLVKRYAFDVAVGDVSVWSFYDKHGSVDKSVMEELVGTAVRLQGIKDKNQGIKDKAQGIKDKAQGIKDKNRSGAVSKKRLPPEIVLRHAMQESRIASYADACYGKSDRVYLRFIDGAADIFDECAQLQMMPEDHLVDCLRPFGKASSKDLAKVQAENLRHIAELAQRLKAGGVDKRTARMILRMEAQERALLEGEADSVKDIKVESGWSPALSADPNATLPAFDLNVRAMEAAARSEKLYEALQNDPEFAHLTERDAENIYFQLLAGGRDGYRDNETLRELREDNTLSDWGVLEDTEDKSKKDESKKDESKKDESKKVRSRGNFWGVKEILRSGADVGAVSLRLQRGARTLDEAIECARLRVNMADVLDVAKIDKTELDKWKAKNFTDVEIAAYRGTLSDWGVLEDTEEKSRKDKGKKVGPRGNLTIDDERMASFHGSKLTADEANNLLALGLVKNASSLSKIKLRHHVDAHVLSEEPAGKGALNEVYLRTIRRPDGTVDERVFKEIAIQNDATWHDLMKLRVGSNLAASMVNERLGFEAIVHTQMSMRNGKIGISMERAKGFTGARLRSGNDTFVTVPKDVRRYEKLHAAVKEDLEKHGAISEETRKWARENLKFTRLRMVGDELQATGDFLADLLEDPSYREKLVDFEINTYLTDELDSHGSNYIVEIRLGPNGATAVAVKGIDADGGFAAFKFPVPPSLRTMPRVMSRRQVDAIKELYRQWKADDGVEKELDQVVLPSNIHVPVKPDVAFPFKHSRDATAAALPPPPHGDQVLQFRERLKLFHKRIRLAEDGKSPMGPDGYPELTIITGGAPKDEVKDKALPVNDLKKEIRGDGANEVSIESDNEIKEDIDNDDHNNDNKYDKDVTWVSDDATKILTNTSSLFARDIMRKI